MGARSKGCITCKARRVKCDETHPTCQRCQKAGINCKGFASGLEIIDETVRIECAVAIRRLQQENYSTLKRSSRVSDSRSAAYQQSQLNVVPSEIPLTAFKHTLYGSYLVHKLAEDKASCIQSLWIETASRGSGNALNALAAMAFGQAHHSKNAMLDAREAYGRALLDLQASLSDISRAGSFDTLSSVTVLCLYEVSPSMVRISILAN
jgi:hypothetical protein